MSLQVPYNEENFLNSLSSWAFSFSGRTKRHGVRYFTIIIHHYHKYSHDYTNWGDHADLTDRKYDEVGGDDDDPDGGGGDDGDE